MEENKNTFQPTLEGLHQILTILRSEKGCPWDREQTRESLTRCLSEEVAELLDAIAAADIGNMKEELGDVLMNLVFQIVIAEELGDFTMRDVLSAINDKMVRRHEHIFGAAQAEDAAAVVALWQEIKAREKGAAKEKESILDGIPAHLSALLSAEELQKKAAKVHFDWSDSAAIVDKIAEELAEVKAAMAQGDDVATDEELGDLLFSVVNLIRFRKRASSEAILRGGNMKFKRRFQCMERLMAGDGVLLGDAGIDVLERYYQLAKGMEKEG